MEESHKSMSDNTNSCKKGNSSQPLSDRESRKIYVREAWYGLVNLILCKKGKAIRTNNMTKDYEKIIKKINIIDPFINKATLIHPDDEIESDDEIEPYDERCRRCPFYDDPWDD